MSTVFFATILPSIGVILSTIQLAVPFATLVECRKQGTIGPLNPVPWVSSFVNCFGWMIYGCQIHDIYIMLSVLFGVALNFYATTTALTLLGAHNEFHKTKDVELIGMGGIVVWLVIGLIVGTGLLEGAKANLLSGSVVLATGLFYYISPISSARQVLKEWDASSINLPMIALNAVATSVWSLYGFYINDPFVYGLNTFALTVSVFFIVVKLILPSRSDGASKKEDDANNKSVLNLGIDGGKGATPLDTVIVGTVRPRAGTADGSGGPIELPVRIAINSSKLEQLVRTNSFGVGGLSLLESGMGGSGSVGNAGGPPLSAGTTRSRAGSNVESFIIRLTGDPDGITSAGGGGEGGVGGDANPGFITRVRGASSAREILHEVVETFVPEVKFDPVQLILDDLGGLSAPVGNTMHSGGGGGGGRAGTYEPPSNNGDYGASDMYASHRLSMIQEEDETRRSSLAGEAPFISPTNASAVKHTTSYSSSSSSTGSSGNKAPADVELTTKKDTKKRGGTGGSSTLQDSLL